MKLTFLVLVLSTPLHAQQLPVQPPTHKFGDTLNICLHGAGAAMMWFDVSESKRALSQPGTVEGNPIVRAGGLIPLKVAGVGAGIGIAYMLHRSGHHKCERVIPLIFGVPSAIAAIHNSTIH
jgi:hypothetical protein